MDFFTNITDSPSMPLPNPNGPLNETGLLKSAGMGFMRGAAELGGAAVIAAGGVVGLMEGGAFDHGTADKVFKFYDDVIRPARDFWTPDPESTSTASNIVGGIAGLGAPLMLGPAAIPALVGSATINTGIDLVEAGVDPVTATGVGIAGGIATGLMVRIPASGKTIAQTMGLIIANPAIGALQEGAQGSLLEIAGYGEAAKMFDPFNPESRAVDLAMGAIFGGMAQYARARGKMPTQTTDALDVINEVQHITKTNILGKKAHEKHTNAVNKAIDNLIEGKKVDVTTEVGDTEARPITPDEGGKEVRKAAKEHDKEIERDSAIIVDESAPEAVEAAAGKTEAVIPLGKKEAVGVGVGAADVPLEAKEPHEMTRDEFVKKEPLPQKGIFDPDAPPTAEGRNISAVKLDDGTIYFDTKAVIHADLIDNLDLPAERIVEGGFIIGNRYTPGGADAARIGAQNLAKRRVEHIEAVDKALSEGKHVPAEVLSDYPELAREFPDVPRGTKEAAVDKVDLVEVKLEATDELRAFNETALRVEEFALENPDMIINVGFDEIGQPRNISVADYINEGKAEIQKARAIEDFYSMAADCLMR